jgi:hypothetical protein
MRPGPRAGWGLMEMRMDVAVPGKYKRLYEKLCRGTWTRAELEWLLKDKKSPPLLVWTAQEKLRLLDASPEAPAPADPKNEGAGD